MEDILIVWALVIRVGSTVEDKGYDSGWYKVLAVVLWIVGRLGGAAAGVLVAGASEATLCLVYPISLLGAITGAAIALLIANSLPPVAYTGPASPPVTVHE